MQRSSNLQLFIFDIFCIVCLAALTTLLTDGVRSLLSDISENIPAVCGMILGLPKTLWLSVFGALLVILSALQVAIRDEAIVRAVNIATAGAAVLFFLVYGGLLALPMLKMGM